MSAGAVIYAYTKNQIGLRVNVRHSDRGVNYKKKLFKYVKLRKEDTFTPNKSLIVKIYSIKEISDAPVDNGSVEVPINPNIVADVLLCSATPGLITPAIVHSYVKGYMIAYFYALAINIRLENINQALFRTVNNEIYYTGGWYNNKSEVLVTEGMIIRVQIEKSSGKQQIIPEIDDDGDEIFRPGFFCGAKLLDLANENEIAYYNEVNNMIYGDTKQTKTSEVELSSKQI